MKFHHQSSWRGFGNGQKIPWWSPCHWKDPWQLLPGKSVGKEYKTGWMMESLVMMMVKQNVSGRKLSADTDIKIPHQDHGTRIPCHH